MQTAAELYLEMILKPNEQPFGYKSALLQDDPPGRAQIRPAAAPTITELS
ncbi:MAG: hypothetical protein H9533_12895 [Rhodobacteraceae bacterium]|nr:hypothetical protein [Paracoccaceae bacterium]